MSKKKLNQDFSKFIKESQEEFNKKMKIIIEMPHFITESVDYPLKTLVEFLMGEWDLKYFENLKPHQHISTDEAYLEYDGSVFHFGNMLSDNEEYKLKIFSHELLLKIISTWNEIIKTHPKRIEIAKEGDVYTFIYSTPTGFKTIVAKQNEDH